MKTYYLIQFDNQPTVNLISVERYKELLKDIPTVEKHEISKQPIVLDRETAEAIRDAIFNIALDAIEIGYERENA